MPESLPLFDNFNPRTAARVSDDITSVIAAERASANVSKGRMLALKHLYENREGLTDFDLERLTGLAQTSIGKRRGDLMNSKYFFPHLAYRTDETRPSPRGAPARVWRITQAGIEFYEKERS
jgi:hypothetical protein